MTDRFAYARIKNLFLSENIAWFTAKLKSKV